MKLKFVTAAVFTLALTASAALAADRYVDPTGGADNPTCSSGSKCATIAHALSIADPGDTIILEASETFTEGELDITKDFITIRGASFALTGYVARATPSTFTGSGHEYIFGISAHNVTIEGIDINTTGSSDTWAGIRILDGGWDRWTIRNNYILNIDDKWDTDASNFSYGVYGDAQTTSGSETMTGGEITGNYFHQLGNGTHLVGSNVTSGVGIYLAGLEGDVTQCDAINRFDCGAWIAVNKFEDLKVGQNQNNFGITDPGGKEYSYGVILDQDDDNALPNNGALVESNAYLGDDFHAPMTDLEIGVHVAIGGSIVNEANANFNSETTAYVLNEGRRATVNELPLADFFKTLFPRVFGEGSDMYFADETEAKNASNDEATIVHLEETSTSPDLYRISVEARGTSASYKVSLDNDGDLNVRQGARLLFDGALSNLATDGVTEIVLDGTSGEDLLTVDFNNGNPTPMAATGIDFDGMDGFDRIVLRGDEQLDYQAIVNTGVDSGTILFEPTASAGIARDGFTPGTTTTVAFDNLEPIDDLLIVNETYSVVAPNDVDNEINIINGPFRFGFDTFQINSGQEATFEEINFANKKNVHIYGADDTGSTNGNDVFTLFTEDGDAPDLLLTINLYGGDVAAGADASDDYFVIRPSKDFDITVSGGLHDTDDWIFLDCANTHSTCNPSLITTAVGGGLPSGTIADAEITGFQSVTWEDVEVTAADLGANDLQIKKELVGFAVNGAHPGDDLEYTVTVTNAGPGAIDMSTTPVWITDVVDHRLSLIEQSIVVTQGSVDFSGNRNMLWRTNTGILAVGASMTMTYTVIVNTLITTDDVDNWASILNQDVSMPQWVTGDGTMEHYAKVALDIKTVFGWPQKAAINTALFYETEAGPRYMVGLNGGAKDPTMFGMGAVLCRVPDTNQEVGWDGGLGNLWYSCGEGLPSNGGIPEPLIVTDLYLDSTDRIWLTSWGHSGLFYSDDGGQTWTDALIDLGGAMGGGPDGNPDGFAQIYAITEDILGTLFISANNGDVYRSFDRGVTWQRAKQLPLGSATTAFSLEADPTLPGTLYAGTFGDSLYVTTDFAETWARPEGDGLGNGYIFDIEIDPLSGNLFVGTAQGIYYSPNGGDNWTGLNSAFPIPAVPPEVRNIAFDSNGAFFASTWGQGVWSSLDWQANALSEFALRESSVVNMTVADGMVNIFTTSGEVFRFAVESSVSSVDTEEAQELPTAYTLEQNYPNPFNPTTSIAFSLPQSAQVSLAVYDVLGRRVATLVNGQLTAGQHSVQFEASSLPSGMYLYRLTTPNGSISQKMILLK